MSDAASGYSDDETILDSDEIWRRVPESQLVFDHNVGKRRLSSGLFNDSSDGTPMSGNLAKEDTVERLLAGHPGEFLAGFPTAAARRLGQGIQRKPTDEDASHLYIFGNKTGRVRRDLKKACRWVVQPPDAD